MASYSYIAVDPRGLETHGLLEVADQGEALRRIKEMGLFPTKIASTNRSQKPETGSAPSLRAQILHLSLPIHFLKGRVKPARLAIFTRQLATLVEAGMPLLRGLRILQEQEENRTLKGVIGRRASTQRIQRDRAASTRLSAGRTNDSFRTAAG